MRVCFSLFLFCLLPLATLQAESPPPSLEVITQTLLQWQDSLKSVSLTYTTTFDAQSESMRQNNMLGVQRFSRTTFCWDDLGRCYYHDVIFHNGKTKMRSLWANDAGKYFRAAYPYNESQQNRPYTLSLSPAWNRPNGPALTTVHYPPFIGLWYPHQEKWLGEMLAEGRGTLQGTEEIEGVICPVIEIDATVNPDYPTRQPVYLHPDYQYLPFRVGFGVGKFGTVIKSYREISPGLFFPAEGEMFLHMDHTEWKLEEMVVNRPLDDALFVPPMGAGTQVTDQRLNKTWINGTQEQHEELRAWAFPDGPPPALPPQEEAGQPQAVPDADPLHILSYVLASVFACLAVALFVLYRRRLAAG